MQSSTYFDNQIIKVQNLEFQRDSTEKNIVDNFMTFSKDTGGIVTGLDLTDGGGTTLDISQGVAYDNQGQRMELYSGISITVSSGTNTIWATLAESDYNPDPTSPPPYPSFPEYNNAQVNIDPVGGSGVNVSTFNTMIVSESSGVGSVPLGLVEMSGGSILSIDQTEPNRQPLKLVGVLNVNTSSIDGSIITPGTLDSTAFTNPLTTDIYLGSGVSIFPIVSGTSSLGTAAIPFLDVSTKELNVTNISGLSPINMMSDTNFHTGFINTSGNDLYVGVDYTTSPPVGQSSAIHVNTITGFERQGVLPPGSLNLPPLTLSSAFVRITGTGYQTGKGVDIYGGGGGVFIQGNDATGEIGRDGATSKVEFFSSGGEGINPGFGGRLKLLGGNSTLTGGTVNLQAGAPAGGGTGKIDIGTAGITIFQNSASPRLNLELAGSNGIITINPGDVGNLSKVDISGVVHMKQGVTTEQTFENMVPNSAFQHYSGSDPFPDANLYPQVWNSINNALSGTTVTVENTSNDTTVASGANVDTYLRIATSGLTAVSGTNILSVPVGDIEANGDTQYVLSYYYKASGIGATTDTTRLTLTPTLAPEPSGLAGGVGTIPPYGTFDDDGEWHKVTLPFTTPTTLINPYLALTLSDTGTATSGDYDIQLTNLQLTKGRGAPKVEPNSTGSYTFLQTINYNVLGTYPLIPEQSVYSKGQFAIVTLDAPFFWGGNLIWNANGNIFLLKNGQSIRSSFYQQWNYGNGGVEHYSLTWHGWLPPGVHTFGSNVQINATTNSTGWAGAVLSVTLI